MTRKYRSQHQKQKQDPDLREVKYILITVSLIMIFMVGTATLGQQAQPLRFLDGVVQYADAVEFYIPPDLKITAHQDGIGIDCPAITGPASADTVDPPGADDFFNSDSADTQGCYYPVFIWDEGSILPREFDPYILKAGQIYSATDWSTSAWNGADDAGNGVGCDGFSVANADDPRINVTSTYEAIQTNNTAIGGLQGTCDRDIIEFQRILPEGIILANDFVNRVNDTYYAIGGKMGKETGSRDSADRGVDLDASEMSLNFVFQLPANNTSTWWQLQEHPMYINKVGTPTGDQFSDNNPPLIDSGFFGIDDTTFTMDTGIDAVERGQVVLFKQFNKTELGVLGDIRVKGGIQSVGSLGDTKIHIEVRDHPLQAGQTQFFSEDNGINQAVGIHDGQDYFKKNQPIKFLNNGSLGVIDIEPTLLGAVEGFDFSLSPYWANSISEIVTVIISLQDNSTTGSLIANITSVEIEDEVKYDFTDINDLLFFEDDCSPSRMSVTDSSLTNNGNDENCGADLSNGLVNMNTVALEGVSGILLTPEAVTNLTVEVITDDTLILKWDHNQGNTTGYRIERDDGSGLVTYIKNTAVSSQAEIPTLYLSGSTKRDGVGGSIDTTFTDINYNVTNYPSRANAFGLEDNTLYSYRVCALNGNLVGTCSATVSQTTPDSEPFWEVVENSGSDASGIGGTKTFALNGGDGDWLKVRSGLLEQGGRDGVLMKSFNITKYNLIENNSFPVWYIDWVGANGNHVSRIQFCDGDFNRFSTNPDGLFQIRKDPQFFCLGHNTVANPTNNDGTGLSESRNKVTGPQNNFQPNLNTITLNLNSTLFPSGFVTVMIGARDRVTTVDQGFDIKNFTWVNSTSWEFEAGSGATMNWTAGINQDNENGRGYGYANPTYANCNAGNVIGVKEIDYKFIDHTFDCDLGTVKAVSSANVVLKETLGTNDWQYREAMKPQAFSFLSISSNSEGILIDASASKGYCRPPTCTFITTSPDTNGNFWIWKDFPKSVLQEGNITINVKGENNGAFTTSIVIPTVTIYNTTVTSEDDALFDRWNSTQWSRNGKSGAQPQGPTPTNYCSKILGSSCLVASMPTNTELTARDGEANTPFLPIKVTTDFSNEKTSDNISVFINIFQSTLNQGTITIENVTVGLKTYNFTNSIIKNEVGENQFDRVTFYTTDDYQFYTGTLGSDMGIITAGSTITQPPNPPTNLNATADISDVELEWTASGLGASATDFKIERGAFPINTANLKVDVTFDTPSENNIGPSSELTNSNYCNVANCNYVVPTGDFGTSQVGTGFSGIVDKSYRWGIAGTAAVALNTTNISDWDFLNTEDWSIGFWMLRDSESGISTFLATYNNKNSGSGSGDDSDGLAVVFDDNNQQVQVFTLENDLVNGLNETSPTLFLEEDLGWHHYFITHDRGNELKWYKDGALIETDSNINASSGMADIGVRIGNCWGSSQCMKNDGTIVGTGGPIGFPSRLDQLLIFNRVIDPSEVSAVYNSGSGLKINSTFATIVPSLLEKGNAVFFDDFSSYPDNATGNAVWVQGNANCQAGTGGTNNFCGVNATSDTIVTKWSNSGSHNISFDLLTNIGITATDSSGIGDFSLTWSHLEDDLGSPNANNYVVSLSNTVTYSSNSQEGICFRFVGSDGSINPMNTQALISLADNEFCGGLDDIDSNVENGANDEGQIRYFNMTKKGDTITADIFTCEEMNIPCRITALSASAGGETYDELRYIRISSLAGSASVDYRFDFDNISLSINGTLLEFYRDRDVNLGTSYQYRVSSLNILDITESDPSDAANVLTNNIPDTVQNTQSTFDTPTKIDVQWDSLAFDSGIGAASTGLNLTKYQVFRQNLTSGDPFVLAGEIFASSPPPNFFNDTGVAFPNSFTYQTSACNPVGCGTNSTASAASVSDPPNALLGSPIFNATAVNNTVSLEWLDVNFAVNYTVTRGLLNASHVIIAQSVPNSNYIDTSIALNTNYTYSAWGVNDNGNGTTGFSNSVLTNNVPSVTPNFTVNMGLVSPYLETPILNWTSPIDQGDGNPTTTVPIINYTVERKQGIGAFSFLKNETNVSQLGTTDDNAIVAVNYTWMAKACNIVGCGPFSSTFSLIVTPTTVPNPVENLTATTMSDTEIMLDWDTPIFNASNQPTEYRIQQRHVGFTGFVTLFDTGNLLTTNTISGLLQGNTYDFRVAGLSGAGQGPYSNIAQNITFTVPTSPQNVTATSLSPTSIFLDWDEPLQTNGGIMNYTIDQATSPFTFVSNTTNTNYTVTGLITKTIYDFRINATNLIGYGPYSQNATNTTFGVPDPPINLEGSTDGINEVTVEWDQPLNNYGSEITGYRIDQAQGIGGTFMTAIANTGNNIEPLEETFMGLLPQTNYVYRIFAFNSFGMSLSSANLTQGTIIGPSEPENVFAVFNATKPYSVFISWDTPLSDGGKTIVGYLVQRQDEGGVFQLIQNITDATIKNYTDTNLINLATHTYKVAAYSNPIGTFSADQGVATVVPANFINFTIDDFEVVGDVLRQDYSFIINDCFPACTFSQTNIERNGVVESNVPFNTAVPLDSEITFTTWFILPNELSNSINTTAFVTNLGSSEDDEAGVTLATAEFLVPASLFFNHTRTSDFEFVNFTLIRHPVPWDAVCEYQNGAGFGIDSSSPFGEAGIQPPISLQQLGFYNDQLDVVPTLNTYVACFDPADNQILSFTSFGFGNGSLALVSFTSQLGDFMGVPVPFIFIIFLAAIWTGRSASTGIIFLSVAIGAMGVLGYFPGLDGNPLLAGTFWSLIVLLTALGVLVGKRFF